MGYSDREMLIMSEIAYMDLEKYYNKYKRENGDTKPTLAQLLDMALVDEDSNVRGHINNIKDMFKEGEEQHWKDWRISAIHNTNDSNGFYACVIETDSSSASLAFRGSESFSKLSQAKTDWVDADLKLLNSTLTTQQNECDIFLQNPILQQYDHLSMVGHSLGGNLAEYSTLVSHNYGLDGKIDQCMSLDGPGFSDEFISEHKDEIEHMKSKMFHKRWSVVGSLLNDLPGVDYKYLKVTNDRAGKDKYNSFSRHDRKYVALDGDKFIEADKPDTLAAIVSFLSKKLDKLPAFVGNTLITIVSGALIAGVWLKENVFDKIKLDKLKKALLVTIAIILAPIAIHMALRIVAVIIVMVALMIISEFVNELLEKTIKFIAEKIGELCKWVKEQVEKLIQYCQELIKNIKKWFKQFSKGYKYAEKNPYVMVDTNLLIEFAEKLGSIGRRLNALDDDMSSLYSKLDLKNQFALQRADMGVGCNKDITKCEKYLRDVASIFEKAERNIESKLG